MNKSIILTIPPRKHTSLPKAKELINNTFLSYCYLLNLQMLEFEKNEMKEKDEVLQSETWIDCAGHLQYLKSKLRTSETIVDEIESTEIVNQEYF
jgi:hypothetical protein